MDNRRSAAVRGPAQKPPRPLSPVTYAGPGDLDALLAFLASVRDEIEGGKVEGDLIADLADALTHRRQGVAFIVRGPDGIEASLGLYAARPLFSRAHFLKAIWHVVAPEARMTGHAKSLLIEGRKFADSLGRPLLIEEMTPDVTTGKAALIGRHLQQAGTVFRYAPITLGGI